MFDIILLKQANCGTLKHTKTDRQTDTHTHTTLNLRSALCKFEMLLLQLVQWLEGGGATLANTAVKYRNGRINHSTHYTTVTLQ